MSKIKQRNLNNHTLLYKWADYFCAMIAWGLYRGERLSPQQLGGFALAATAIRLLMPWLAATTISAGPMMESGFEAAYGVEFSDVNAQTNIFLKSFVYQNLVEQPHKRL